MQTAEVREVTIDEKRMVHCKQLLLTPVFDHKSMAFKRYFIDLCELDETLLNER
jgi:hypothetical protein